MSRCGIDLDGIVYDWSGSARFLLEYEFGIPIGESLYWNYIYDRVDKDQWKWLWSDDPGGGIDRGLFLHGNVFKGSFEALRELDELGHDLVILTHRPKSAQRHTLQWLSLHEIPTSEIHHLYREEKKSSVLPYCDIYVDDKFENVIDLAENTPGLVCLWSRPWNIHQQANLSKNIEVINTWQEFMDLAKEETDLS